MDSEQTEARQGERRRRTAYLIVGGVLSLLLPLLGALYLKLSETAPPAGNVDAAAVFAHRDGPAPRLLPAAAPAAPGQPAAAPPVPGPAPSAPGSESGLSMVRGGQDYYQEPQPPPQPAPAKAAPAPAPAPKPIPQPKAVEAPASSFSFAKLKPVSGFGSWFSKGQGSPAAGQKPAGPGPDIGALMNSMRGSGGSGAAPAPAAPAAPDISALLKNLPQTGGAQSPSPQ